MAGGGVYRINMAMTNMLAANSNSTRTDGTALIDVDPWLAPYTDQLRRRYAHYQHVRKQFDAGGGLLGEVSSGHHYFGFNRGELWGKPGVWYREWAPAALQLRLIGEFNDWDRMGHPLVRDQFGVWSLFLPDDKWKDTFVHGGKLKVHVVTEKTGSMDRIPAYIKRVVPDPWSNKGFVGQFWEPPTPYAWRHKDPPRPASLRIYKSHVGMAQEEGKVG